MKTAIYCSVFTLVSLWSLSVFAQGTCHNDNGGGYPNAGGNTGYPYEQTGPYGQPGPYDNVGPYGSVEPAPTYPMQAPGASPYVGLPVAAAAPVGPTAKITVVSATPSTSSSIASTVPTAKLKVIANEAIAAEPVIDEKIAGIVGTWKAVARQGDGELTTIELHLDNRGWAELTVPGTDGKPTTTKSRVNLENEELKLTDADKVVSLGKLVDFNTRQMVLERAEGRVTFVRL